MAARDLKERTFAFARRTVVLCLELDRHQGVGRMLGNQVLCFATLIGANDEEAHARQSRADFTAKTSIV